MHYVIKQINFMVFLDFGQILMDNHKLVTISVLIFLKHDKNAPLFLENKHEKPLEFSRIHEKKKHIFVFFKMTNFLNSWRKIKYF
jgi:hypothetical protein